MSYDAPWKEWRNEVGYFLIDKLNMQTALILRTERLLSDTGVFTRWTRRAIGRDGVQRQLRMQLSRGMTRIKDWMPNHNDDHSPTVGYARFVADRLPVAGPLTYTQHLISLQPHGNYADLQHARRVCYTDLQERSHRRVLLTRMFDAQIAATIDAFLPWTHEWMFLIFVPALHRTELIICEVCWADFNEPADAILHASVTHICCFPHGWGYGRCDCGWRYAAAGKI
jgi:hypothetical protein